MEDKNTEAEFKKKVDGDDEESDEEEPKYTAEKPPPLKIESKPCLTQYE